jgi:hypothetical protein
LHEEIAAAVAGLSAEQLKQHPLGGSPGVLVRGLEQELPHGLSRRWFITSVVYHVGGLSRRSQVCK